MYHFGAPPKKFFFYGKLFFIPFSLMLHPNGFLFSTLPSWNVFSERPIAPSPASSRPLLSFSSLRRPYLHYNLCDSFYSVMLLASPTSPKTPFSFQVGQTRNETKILQVFLEDLCIYTSAHAFSYFCQEGSLWLPWLGFDTRLCLVWSSFFTILSLRLFSLSPRCGLCPT